MNFLRSSRLPLFSVALAFVAIAGPALAATTVSAEDAAAANAKVDQLLDRIAAVQSAGWPLLVAGTDYCNVDTAYRTGIDARSRPDLTTGKDRVEVVGVAKGSPADLAGIKRKDTLTAVNGDSVGKRFGGNSDERVTELLDEAAESDEAVTFSLVRDGQPLEIEVTPVLLCDLKLQYLPSQGSLNTAESGYVVVTEMMFDVTESEFERQAYLASEMSFALTKAVAANRRMGKFLNVSSQLLGAFTGNSLVGAAGSAGTLAHSLGTSKELSLKADRTSVFLLASIGSDVEQLPAFWSRFYERAGSNVDFANWLSLRPTAEDRLSNLQAAVAEVAKLRAEGKPLAP
ncbi:MAG: PDZ domain-containing protein [Pseudoxanthomonas sp.]|nr:PDZ domain-containing protein [Pseudoxanthomonas sp.]